jgi:flagellar assembly protein FliH
MESEIQSVMRASGPLIEAFVYPDCPWSEDLAGLRRRWAEVFPGSSVNGEGEWAGTGGGVTADLRVPEVGRRGNGNTSNEDGALSGRTHDLTDEQLAEWLSAEVCKAEERGRIQGLEKGVEAGVEKALEEGRREAIAGLEKERSYLHSQAGALLKSFAEERECYLQQLEQEAVQLALSIAARILRREAQIDPLLLMGAVRVALGQLADSTAVRLRVPAQDRELWTEALALIPGLTIKPEVIGDEWLSLGDCRMETELGSADLGLRAQLKEIERGFFDRVDGRRTEPVAGYPGRDSEAELLTDDMTNAGVFKSGMAGSAASGSR